MKKIILLLIKLYQKYISIFLGKIVDFILHVQLILMKQ